MNNTVGWMPDEKDTDAIEKAFEEEYDKLADEHHVQPNEEDVISIPKLIEKEA